MDTSILEPLSSSTTMLEAILRRESDPDRSAFILHSMDEGVEDVSAGRFLDESRRIASGLRNLGVKPDDRVFLVLPTSTDFVFSYWGILFAGATPAPAYPPAGINKVEAFIDSLRRMLAASGSSVVVVPDLLREVMQGVEFPGVQFVTPEEIRAEAGAADGLPVRREPDDLALIQFSSGSTGDPRGVCLSHSNLLANATAFLKRLDVRPGDGCVTWLPLYHDMGLIGTMLGPMMIGYPVVLIPPTDFLRKPGVWLEALSKYRGTITVAPQFAFSLCLRRLKPGALGDIDLSSVRVMLNGAEPIYRDEVEKFEDQFAEYGLAKGVVTPTYGLAEGTLAASMVPPGSPRVWRQAEKEAEGAEPAGEPTSAVSVGPAMDGTELCIRGPKGEELPDGAVGEICIRSASVCQGLLENEQVNPITDAAGWLPSRDLGFMKDGELHITGRIKDLIILGGRNLYPQDIEALAAELPTLRPGRIAAFGIQVPERATEALVMVAETTETSSDDAAAQVSELRQRILQRFGVTPYDTILLKKGRIPTTTSGKLRRHQTRVEYEKGQFDEVVYRTRSV